MCVAALPCAFDEVDAVLTDETDAEVVVDMDECDECECAESGRELSAEGPA